MTLKLTQEHRGIKIPESQVAEMLLLPPGAIESEECLNEEILCRDQTDRRLIELC